MVAMSLEEFIPIYNSYISDWLDDEINDLEEQLVKAEPKVAEGLERKLEKLLFRKSLGDFLNRAEEGSIPKNLVWEDGLNQPEFADPKAKQGGVFYEALDSFPPTLRLIGPNSNSGFRGTISDNNSVPLVGLHPTTSQTMPGLAKRWALSEDRRTVYYEIHADITYNDGSLLEISDFHRNVFVRTSDYVSNPYGKQYYREQVAQITLYSDSLLSVTLPEPKPLMPAMASVPPAPKEFYSEYGPDYEERYQWRSVPTTGPYYIDSKDILKGVSIAQTRVDDWWADDKKFYRYRYNPKVVNHTVIRDPSKQFELFKIGKVDSYNITIPERFYEKSEIEPVFDGYIEKSIFYHKYVQTPRGFFLNMSKPKLQELDFRLGVHYSMNWEKVINVVQRGDYSRLAQFYEGFEGLTNTALKPRRFSITKARDHFAKLGYKKLNEKGFLENEAGEELSVTLTYYQYPYYTKMLKILQEEAKKAGLNLLLDANESSVFSKVMFEKKHEMAFSGWGASPPFPNYYQFFHSSNAYDQEGNPKPYTNNLNCFADDRMDELSEASRNAETIEELNTISMEAQKLIHDAAIFVPSYGVDFFRIAHWRWIQFPNTEEVQFSPPIVNAPFDLHLHWVDEEIKAETLTAKRKGESFPEKVKIYDQYRRKGGAQ